LFSLLFTSFFLIKIYCETPIEEQDGSKMMYRNHKEYNQPPKNSEYENLQSWLRGDTGVESLKEWLGTMYN